MNNTVTRLSNGDFQVQHTGNAGHDLLGTLTMPSKQALQELIEKVEAGKKIDGNDRKIIDGMSEYIENEGDKKASEHYGELLMKFINMFLTGKICHAM